MKSTNVLIIGGAGYIGSHQVNMMINEGYNVTVIDNLSTGHREMVDERASFIQGDIRDFDLLVDVLTNNNIDVVMHFAAFSIVPESVEQPLKYYNNNVYGFEVLLLAMSKTNVNKLVFSSTAAVYGEHVDMPITEDYLTMPTNPYGDTKLAMEKMARWISGSSELEYVILRYFNVAGASLDGKFGELHNPETHLIPIVLQAALGQRDYVSIYGDDYDTEDGTCIRDYIHVVDLCQAHKLAVDYLDNNGNSDVFNLGYGKGFSVKEIIDSVKEVCKKDFEVRIDKRRAGDPALLIASSDKAKSVLQWVPKYNDINKIIETAFNFYNAKK